MNMDFPFIGPVFIFWASVVLIVFFVSFFGYLGRRNKYRLLEKLAESGKTIPPELLQSLDSKLPSMKGMDPNPVASGITLMCIGVALIVFFWAFNGFNNPFTTGDAWFIAIGIFPFMIGLARVLGAVVGRRQEAKTE
ncbi:hypothetical protein FHS83_003480 [Rhizomicrobium palustre]|uniref:DUF6249 domain-containing protein n=1 Tax=Rhizomicrobium palustre TaxID=189966 RepID=A0A846N4P4_9PROT|nr:DUF6249 domain-containing protein [Rhizomicrobium palustre]NIK90162.1 hypothetical protein [Rhizomicrobium palustre]